MRETPFLIIISNNVVFNVVLILISPPRGSICYVAMKKRRRGVINGGVTDVF